MYHISTNLIIHTANDSQHTTANEMSINFISAEQWSERTITKNTHGGRAIELEQGPARPRRQFNERRSHNSQHYPTRAAGPEIARWGAKLGDKERVACSRWADEKRTFRPTFERRRVHISKVVAAGEILARRVLSAGLLFSGHPDWAHRNAASPRVRRSIYRIAIRSDVNTHYTGVSVF